MPQSHSNINLDELVDAYKNSLGIEGAQTLIKKVILQQALSYKLDYTKEEALKICEGLKSEPGFVGIIAKILMSKFT